MNLLLRCGEKIEGQLAPSAGSEVAEVERAEASAVARDDLGADAGEHAADSVVTAFGERERGFAGGNHRERGGGAARGFLGEDEGPAAKSAVISTTRAGETATASVAR